MIFPEHIMQDASIFILAVFLIWFLFLRRNAPAG